MHVFYIVTFLVMAGRSFARHADVAAPAKSTKYIMYLTGQHPELPPRDLLTQVTHVTLAFLSPALFNDENTSSYPLFTTVEKVRAEFAENTKVLVAIGGWGDTEGFEIAAKTDESREKWAKGVAKMVQKVGADGVDVDWEYPGGNGEDYKTNPNPTKAWQIEAYPLLLSTLRSQLPSPLLISAAVPGLPRDMLAFTSATVPEIMKSVDYLNVMTYDLMNRRDTITKHHTGVQASFTAVQAYIDAGAPAEKLNLGFAFYVKWFKVASDGGCEASPVGCKTVLMEDPNTGVDLGQAGAFSYHDSVPMELIKSWTQAQADGVYDKEGGGHYYLDADEHIWWSWDTETAIGMKFWKIVEPSGVGGVFAWGLGEDGPKFKHLEAMNLGMESWSVRADDRGGGGRRCGTGPPPPEMLREL